MTSRSAPVPQGRTTRLLHLGRAVGEMATSAAVQGVSQWASGQRPSLESLWLSPANAVRLAERLSTMRGAVMKVGQLMSMDGQGVLPAPFADLLATLRDQAHVMPKTQLAEVLEREYGPDWYRRFQRLSFEPIAAASIGQVHRAETHDGKVLALKIQYPGVRTSIDSDVANLSWLLRIPGLVPGGLDAAPLLERLREQLQHETDYRAEAQATTAYAEALGDDPAWWVPPVVEAHSTDHILATGFSTGQPLDRLTLPHTGQALRDAVATALCRLALKELFDLRRVQTDPNLGNYLVDPGSGRLTLLDFGATETVEAERVAQLRALARAMKHQHLPDIEAAARAIGYVGEGDSPQAVRGVVGLLNIAGEPLQGTGPYDFGTSTLVSRVFEQGRAQLLGDGFTRTPPADLMFLQRKFIGTFLLCAKLRARVNLSDLFAPYF